MCACAHTGGWGWFRLYFSIFRDCSPWGWLDSVKDDNGEIRLSEFFTGDVGWIVVGARIHPSGYFRNEIR